MASSGEEHGGEGNDEEDYGDVAALGSLRERQAGYAWAEVAALDPAVRVRARGRVAFLLLRQGGATVQCVASGGAEPGVGGRRGRRRRAAAGARPRHHPAGGGDPKVQRLYCVSKAVPKLPIKRRRRGAERGRCRERQGCREAARSCGAGQAARLQSDRPAANRAIFKLRGEVEHAFRQALREEGFDGIQTPKLISGSSEGGAAVFKLDYKGQPAFLAQSPQLHKQMAVSGGFQRIFEVGAVYRAEDSYTHRHLCEFTGLDVEMTIRDDYSQVCDVVDKVFVAIFDHLNKNCAKELETIRRQYPFKPLKYLEQTLRIDYNEGIRMLKEAGVHVEPMGDLNTEAERKLGELVRDKYDTEFYMLCRYPSAVRPFYTMPCADDPLYSYSFDVFVRGEEIISGAQRVHDPKLLTSQAKARGIDVNTIANYIDSFRYGTPPHGGVGAGLERVVMLFCGLGNIRKTSLFPRDPRGLNP